MLSYKSRFEKINDLPNDLPIKNGDVIRQILTRDKWDVRPYREKKPYGNYYKPIYNLDIVPHTKHDIEENVDGKRSLFIDTKNADIDENNRPILIGNELSKEPMIEKDQDFLYRGISNGEFQNIIKTGVIQSHGDYNFENQSGRTYFSTDPQQAINYGGTFSPYQYLPSFNNPGYVIKIKRPDNIVIDPNDSPTEIGISNPIDANEIVDIIRLQPYAVRSGEIELIPEYWGPDRGEYVEGMRMSPIPYIGYTRDSLDILKHSSNVNAMIKIASNLDNNGQYDIADIIDTMLNL